MAPHARLNVSFAARSPLPGDLAEGDYVIWQGMGSYSTVTNTRFNGFGDVQIATVLTLKL